MTRADIVRNIINDDGYYYTKHSVLEIVNVIFDEHEAQLKESCKLHYDLMISGEQRGVNKGTIKASKIVAMLFWEWKKAVSKRKYKEQIKKEHCDHHDNPIAYYYAHEEMALWNFRKSYAMLKKDK